MEHDATIKALESILNETLGHYCDSSDFFEILEKSLKSPEDTAINDTYSRFVEMFISSPTKTIHSEDFAESQGFKHWEIDKAFKSYIKNNKNNKNKYRIEKIPDKNIETKKIHYRQFASEQGDYRPVIIESKKAEELKYKSSFRCGESNSEFFCTAYSNKPMYFLNKIGWFNIVACDDVEPKEYNISHSMDTYLTLPLPLGKKVMEKKLQMMGRYDAYVIPPNTAPPLLLKGVQVWETTTDGKLWPTHIADVCIIDDVCYLSSDDSPFEHVFSQDERLGRRGLLRLNESKTKCECLRF